MNFKEKEIPEKKYVRKMEGMDEWQVMFEISSVISAGYHNHFCFVDRHKPPLDIAFHPENGTVGYINYFLQDEKIERVVMLPKVVYKNTSISMYDERFDRDHRYIDINKQFKIYINKNDIWVLHETAWETELTAYRVGESDHLLFGGDEFLGFKMENLNEQEMQVLYDSKGLSRQSFFEKAKEKIKCGKIRIRD